MKKSLLFVTSCLLMLGVGAGVSTAIVSNAETLEANAATVDPSVVENLGHAQNNNNTYTQLYFGTENAPTKYSRWGGDICSPVSGVEGYNPGRILLNGLDVTGVAKMTYCSKEGAAFTNFWIDIRNTDLSPTFYDTMVIEGCFLDAEIEGKYYFNFERTMFAIKYDWENKPQWRLVTTEDVEDIGNLVRNANTSKEVIYCGSTVKPSFMGDTAWGSNRKDTLPLTYYGDGYTKGSIVINGTDVVSKTEQLEIVGGSVGFSICRDGSAETYEKGKTVTVEGLFWIPDYNKAFYVHKTTFIAENNGWKPVLESGSLVQKHASQKDIFVDFQNGETGFTFANWYVCDTGTSEGTIKYNGTTDSSGNFKRRASTLENGKFMFVSDHLVEGESGPKVDDTIEIEGHFCYYDGADTYGATLVGVHVEKTIFTYQGSTNYWVMTFDYSGARQFTDNYMHMKNYPYELGFCKDTSHGFYAAAKAAYNSMSSAAKNAFATDPDFASAYSRLQFWALNNGDTLLGTTLSSSSRLSLNSDNNNLILPIVLISLISISAISCVVILKRKHK